jgi:hypothetical protein
MATDLQPSIMLTTKLFEEMKRQDKEANHIMLDRSTFSVSPLPNLLDLFQHQSKLFPKRTAIVASTFWTCILQSYSTPICIAKRRNTPNIDPPSSTNQCDIPRCEACQHSKQKRRSILSSNKRSSVANEGALSDNILQPKGFAKAEWFPELSG